MLDLENHAVIDQLWPDYYRDDDWEEDEDEEEDLEEMTEEEHRIHLEFLRNLKRKWNEV